ncbi:hypothetical protein [Hymenobacter sp. UYP22]|uniref:hypothetical protein n=1 Tax=Hymenobacter sp. UYP22 TaxID=3156348 RepID=UPI0033952F9E
MKKIVFFLAVNGLTGCIKKDITPQFTLPPETQQGANTLGFIVNNRVWQNYGRRCTTFGCSDNQLQAHYSSKYGQFLLSAGLTTRDHDDSFGLEIKNLYSTGTYFSLAPIGPFDNPGNSFGFSESKGSYYVSATPGATKIVITRFDTINKIISGTFDGRLDRNTNPTSNIIITDGRFDVKYE